MKSTVEDPTKWCISYQQLLDIDQEARDLFGEENYQTKTMRDICHSLFSRAARKRVLPTYALSLNPEGLDIDVFITHSWDGYFILPRFHRSASLVSAAVLVSFLLHLVLDC